MKRNLLTALLGLALAGLPWKANAETDGSTRLRALEAEFIKATAERGFDEFTTSPMTPPTCRMAVPSSPAR